ncbi:EF-P beta-lysylation protein EpmB [Rehaibacterium terrae]|jgi:EF-P beta-lysylation protein EpmB|uniref:L-lysine 2,3-aminomutase n=1 Tax=Rehaibacterium terrae TaxID=1341696 RepID=A0A7W7Y1B5_9GAMM|nr:EF-P beta-lysylation protein EpmB [Rehaibacterium terrae]MBB5016283.1 EF-P beta-lysylation protein EpmB [Rehaibacterium terrae]
MITANPLPAQPRRWQTLWRQAVRDPRELLSLLGLESLAGRISAAAAAQFPLRVPHGFIARMRPGDPDDPLLRQVLPVIDEERIAPGYDLDAVGDLAARGASGVLHKYDGRALLIATGSCAVHCRYCFRRHFPYGEETAAANGWRQALDYLAADTSLSEVLLSGGDPLSLATRKLAELTDALAGLPHVRRLRIHTRLPIVLPERVDEELLDWLTRLPQQVVVVVHANHPHEIDGSVRQALLALQGSGATLLNQAVLLRGVNDDAGTLAALCERLFETRTLPYYLHQLDRVAGAAHFEVPEAQAIALHEALMRRLPGYLVPRLVRERAGAPYKVPLTAPGSVAISPASV